MTTRQRDLRRGLDLCRARNRLQETVVAQYGVYFDSTRTVELVLELGSSRSCGDDDDDDDDDENGGYKTMT